MTFYFNLLSSSFHFLYITKALYFPSSPVSLNQYILHPLTFTPFLQLSYDICKHSCHHFFFPTYFHTSSTFSYFLALFLLHHLTPVLTSDVSSFQLSQLIIFPSLSFLHAAKSDMVQILLNILMVSLWDPAVEDHKEVMVSWKKTSNDPVLCNINFRVKVIKSLCQQSTHPTIHPYYFQKRTDNSLPRKM